MVSISGLPTSGKVAASGAVLTVIGSVLPWASAVGETVLGVDGDGIITAPLAVIVLALAVLRWDKIGAGVSAVLGLAALLTAFNAYSNIESLGGFAGALVSVEYGST